MQTSCNNVGMRRGLAMLNKHDLCAKPNNLNWCAPDFFTSRNRKSNKSKETK